jgi:hypothetical protein
VPEPPDFDAPFTTPSKARSTKPSKKPGTGVNGCVHCFDNEKELFENLSAFLSGYHPETIVCAEPEIKSNSGKTTLLSPVFLKFQKKWKLALLGVNF